MNKEIIVSVDFDKTLTEPIVQSYVKGLLDLGVIIIVVTARYNDFHTHLWEEGSNNNDLYEITNKLGIPLNHIIFQNGQAKWVWFHMSNVQIHLDDSNQEIKMINMRQVKTKGILYDPKNKNWMKEIQEVADKDKWFEVKMDI